jgi:hypothetical protein
MGAGTVDQLQPSVFLAIVFSLLQFRPLATRLILPDESGKKYLPVISGYAEEGVNDHFA